MFRSLLWLQLLIVSISPAVLQGQNQFSAIAGNTTVSFSSASGQAGHAVVTFSIAENLTNPGFPTETQGFSLGCTCDPALLSVVSVSPGAALSALNGGTGPSFFTGGMFPNGWTRGVVYSILGTVFMEFDVPRPVVRVEYAVNASSLVGSTTPTVTDLLWANTLGTPPVFNVTVVAGISSDVDFVHGSITLEPQIDLAFLRGDCNDDGTVNIADAVWLIQQVTGIGDQGICFSGCDANGDGLVDTSDVIYVVTYRFLAGASPPQPFPACGLLAGAACADKLHCP